MEPAIQVAVAALIVSLLNILITSVFTAKNYKKSRRLEFLQRRDRLSQKISEVNDRNTEAHLISARYELVAVRNAGLPLREEQAERNTALIASIKKLREGIEGGIKLWDENIQRLHLIGSNLNLETDGPEIEKMITIVQVASDNLKKTNDNYSAALHILETSNELIKTTLAESAEQLRQIDRDFERAIEGLTRKDV